MAKLMERRPARIMMQYFRFCLIGFTNLGVDMGTYLLLTRTISFFDQWRVAGHVVSFSLAVINSYIWNSRWVFRAENLRSRKKEAVRFTKFVVVQTLGLVFSSLVFISLTTPHWLIPDVLMKHHNGWLTNRLYEFLANHQLFPPDAVFSLGIARLHGDVIAKFFTAVAVSLWNFPANKLWTFRNR